MALKAENPVVGGTVLRRAAVQSPNFVHNVSGWSINQDGSAEFNNIVIRNGQIVSGTALYYSGTPSAANLVLAISAVAGADAFGTNFYAGTTFYATSAGHSFPVNLLSADHAAFFQYAAPSGGVQGGIILAVSSAGATDPVTGAGYPAGLYGLDPAFGDNLTVVGANIDFGQVPYTRAGVVAAFAGSGALQPVIQLDAPEQTTASHMQMRMAGASPDGTVPPQLLVGPVTGSGTLTNTTHNMLEVQGGAAQTVMGLVADVTTTLAFTARTAGDTNARTSVRGDGRLGFGSGSAITDSFLAWLSANRLGFTTCDVAIHTVGRGLQIAEGANAKQGTAVLNGGSPASVVVANTAITANSRVQITNNALTGVAVPPSYAISARTPGTSFTILSSANLDTSTVAYFITEPG